MTTPRLPRDDLTAALAARRELGPDYDEAFIETVVARIEETLAARSGVPVPQQPAPAPDPKRAKAERDTSLSLAIVSLIAAIPLSGIGAGVAELPGLLIVWVGIVLVNIVFSCRPQR